MARPDGLPTRHLQIPESLLDSGGVPPMVKLALFAVDACARRDRTSASTVALAEQIRCSERAMRKYLHQAVGLDYARRTQTSNRLWSTRLINRLPAAWLPHWALHWWRSDLGRATDTDGKMQPAIMALWAYFIWKTPTRSLVRARRHVRPWAEVPVRTLARVAGVKRHYVTALLELMAMAGLIVMVDRGKDKSPAVYPMHYPWTADDRDEHVSCLIEMVAERDEVGTLQAAAEQWDAVLRGEAHRADLAPLMASVGVHGVDAPTAWDDAELATYLRRTAARPASRAALPVEVDA